MIAYLSYQYLPIHIPYVSLFHMIYNHKYILWHDSLFYNINVHLKNLLSWHKIQKSIPLSSNFQDQTHTHRNKTYVCLVLLHNNLIYNWWRRWKTMQFELFSALFNAAINWIIIHYNQNKKYDELLTLYQTIQLA